MSFFTRQGVGRVYVLKLVLPDQTVLHKIGMTNSNRVTDRMMEILRSWFVKYRYVPYCELRKDMECGFPKELEHLLHRIFHRKRWEAPYSTDGSTEMFAGLNEGRLLHFMSQFNDDNFKAGLHLTDKDCKALGEFLAP